MHGDDGPERTIHSMMRFVAFGVVVALVQCLAVIGVHLAWRHSSGGWSKFAWLTYFIGFPIASPVVGVGVGAATLGVPASLRRRMAVWGAVVIISAVFIVVAHGLEDAGWPFWASTLAYSASVAAAGFVACLGAAAEPKATESPTGDVEISS